MSTSDKEGGIINACFDPVTEVSNNYNKLIQTKSCSIYH